MPILLRTGTRHEFSTVNNILCIILTAGWKFVPRPCVTTMIWKSDKIQSSVYTKPRARSIRGHSDVHALQDPVCTGLCGGYKESHYSGLTDDGKTLVTLNIFGKKC